MKEFVHHQKLMGSAFSLGIVAKNQTIANYWLQKGVDELKRIEALLSEYRPDSVTAFINNLVDNEPLAIPEEVLLLIRRSNEISKLTRGAFDITSSPLKKIYSFNNAAFEFPENEIIKKAISSVGYQNLVIDGKNGTITKLKPNMHISFNAIGKGYASDCVKKLWQQNRIESGFINASGDLCAFGKKADGTCWRVGIANPDNKIKPMLYIPINNRSVATSGNYEQFFLWKGKRYSHNINPKTGLPLHGIKSVTIVSPSAELSDALATAVYVMGEKKGTRFADQLPQTYSIIINDKNRISCSKHLEYESIAV